ncbi:MAG: type II secretion system secretin GspD [Proteobacteria bacterium]|nr:type II secretion system secretin GspD [Pseudomonadota bacterium]
MAKSIAQNLISVGLINLMIGSSIPQGAFAQDDMPPPPAPDVGTNYVPEPEAAPSVPDVSRANVTKVGGDTAKVVIDEKRGAEAVPSGQELVNMDFPEPTEIKDIIRAVALWTGKNVILDRNVSGKIQIISPKRVTKEEAYQAFLSALNVLQFTTVETGKIIKIMPIRTAIKGNLRTFLGSKWTPLTDEIITQIVPLKYVDSKSIQNTLNRIISPNSMVAYEKTNTLIISDSGYKVRRILDILDLIDVQGQQPQVAFVPIRYADAKTIVERVSEILKANSAGGGSYGAFKLMTDERSNSVIVFGPPRTISDVQGLVKKFDIEIEDPTRQSTIHVRPLEYADAKKVAATLSSLAQGNKNKNRPASSFVPPPINGVTPISGAQSISAAELDDNTKITADESSNSLLITGSRSAYQSVNSIVRKLDVRRSQVFVEADILDLTAGNRFDFGTSIFGGAKAGQNPLITTWQGKDMVGLIGAQAGASTSTPGAEAASKVAGTFANDLTIGILSNQEVNVPGIGKFKPSALIKLIKSDGNTRVLSSPHIMTSNNEEAKIVVGEKVFFRSSETNATTGLATPKVEKEDVDLSLTLKPNISNSNYVTMKVDIEASSVELDADTKLPKVAKRKTNQTMTVKNGQTVVVSGLVNTSQSEQFQKIPLLGDIPILGWLFRNSTINHRTNNMLIFMTPHIIHGADDLAAIYQKKVKERDDYLEYVYGSNFKDDRFYALMPKMEDGAYKPDASDNAEKARREAVFKSLLDDEDTSTAASVKEETKSDMASPTPVPMNATLGGSSGGSSMGGDSSLPPPPVPQGGDDMGSDIPPPPPPPEPIPDLGPSGD